MEMSSSKTDAFHAKGQQDQQGPLGREHLGCADLMTIRSKPFKIETLLWQI